MKHLKEIVYKNKTLVMAYIACGITIAFLNNFSANYFQKLIDRFTDNSLDFATVFIYGVVLLSLCLINYVDEYPGRKLENSIFLDLKIKALEKIKTIDYEAYESMGTGKLIQRIENGADAGKSIAFDFYFCLIREIIPSILFSMTFIYKISKPIMIMILAGYIVVFIVTNLLLKALYEIKEHILCNEEEMNHYLVRGFMEMVVFRVNKRFDYEIKKSLKSKNEIVNSKVKMTMIHEAFFTIFAVLITIVKIAIIVYGWKTRSLTVGSIVALITLVDNAYTPIAIFNVLFVQYKLDKSAFNRYAEFLDIKDDEMLYRGNKVENIRGEIAFDNINFQYGERKIFDNININMDSGDKVALVGESGSGKSTLIKLLVGLLKPSRGKVDIDNMSLSDINLNSFYDNISYVSQESPIFDGTLRENLVFDRKIKDEVIIEILRKVKLYDLYEKLPMGLNTELGERGVVLSGGERQRLALARLWFEDSKIVILDEATSAMDNITEEKVMSEVMDLLRDKTVIVIAHRLNSIKNFQRILVFKDGKIVEDGNFDCLIQENSYFGELYSSNIN